MLLRQIVLVVSVLLLAGCTDSPAPAPLVPTEEPQALTGLRGTSLDGTECPKAKLDQGAVAQPTPDAEIPRPTSLTLCTNGRRTYQITADDPLFRRVLNGLSTPDPSDPPSGCLDYADAPVSLVATTGDGFYLVHIPEDGCGHYNREVKKTLYAGDSDRPPTETPLRAGWTGGLGSADIRNVTVSGDACFSPEPIHLHNGYALIPNRNGSPNQPEGKGRRYYRLTLWEVAYGDLAGNEGSEAVLTLICTNNGGTGAGTLLVPLAVYSGPASNLHELAVLPPQMQESHRQATRLLDAAFTGGRVTVQEHIYGRRDPDCCASGEATTVWTYSGGTFEPHTTVTKTPR